MISARKRTFIKDMFPMCRMADSTVNILCGGNDNNAMNTVQPQLVAFHKCVHSHRQIHHRVHNNVQISCNTMCMHMYLICSSSLNWSMESDCLRRWYSSAPFSGEREEPYNYTDDTIMILQSIHHLDENF